MRVMACLAAVLVGLLLGAARANFVVEKAGLVMDYGGSKTKYEMALANFGVPLYGGNLRARILYPHDNQWGCDDFAQYGITAANNWGAGVTQPVVLLIERGPPPPGVACTFTKKAFNAQKAGAAAIVVASNLDSLTTMDGTDDEEAQMYVGNVTIPAALITKTDADDIKSHLDSASFVMTEMDWSDVLPHPDDRVEWEFWTNSNDAEACGSKCQRQKDFINEFSPVAQLLEQGGYTEFTPHYITWLCPVEYRDYPECKQQCVNNGRYCCPDPEDDLLAGYEGKDVVIENLRQLCVFRLAKNADRPWLWWDYVRDFGTRCKMADQRYNAACAKEVFDSLDSRNDGKLGGFHNLEMCMGDTEIDADNNVLRGEQEAQVSDAGGRGDVTILPTIMVNNVQYRGRMDKASLLRAVCAGFKEGTEPSVCHGDDIPTSDICDEGKMGQQTCAGNSVSGKTQCMNDFTCQCPDGLEEVRADGVSSCQAANMCRTRAMGVDKCTCDRCVCFPDFAEAGPGFTCDELPNPCDDGTFGGMWHTVIGGTSYSACKDNIQAVRSGAANGDISPKEAPHKVAVFECPQGFQSATDPTKGLMCTRTSLCDRFCVGKDRECTDLVTDYKCECKVGGYIKDSDACVSQQAKSGSDIGVIVGSALLSILVVGGLLYGAYQYRLKSYMDSEIRAIMSQYMPLDGKEGGAPGEEGGDEI